MEIEVPSPEENIAWLSGIIDGEGCLGLYKAFNSHRVVQTPNYYTRLAIYNTNLLIINRAKSIIHSLLGIYRYEERMDTRGNRKPCYRFVVSKRKLGELLKIIRLTGKAEQQRLLLEAQQIISSNRFINKSPEKIEINKRQLEDIRLRMKKLNRRGKIDA